MVQVGKVVQVGRVVQVDRVTQVGRVVQVGRVHDVQYHTSLLQFPPFSQFSIVQKYFKFPISPLSKFCKIF